MNTPQEQTTNPNVHPQPTQLTPGDPLPQKDMMGGINDWNRPLPDPNNVAFTPDSAVLEPKEPFTAMDVLKVPLDQPRYRESQVVPPVQDAHPAIEEFGGEG